MARAIEELGRLRVGYAELGMHGDRQGSVNQQVHDGDTITVKTAGREPEDEIGNLAVRFLGVDAPEVSLPLPGQDGFVSIGDDRWKEYLEDPFQDPFDPPLDGDLIEHLRERLGPNAATNHARHAEEGHRALENLILEDLDELGQESADFRFFFVFAHEVMDGHARLLCYVNRFQPNENDPAPRPQSYNVRLLGAGRVTPYFIWPNVDPFRRSGSLVEAVPEPGSAAALASGGEDGRNALSEARDLVRAAREAELGVFEKEDPLMLLPFELRFLSRQEPPDRWVVDLTSDGDELVPPQRYWTISNTEDRLFVPEEYVPLFVEKGWRRKKVGPG